MGSPAFVLENCLPAQHLSLTSDRRARQPVPATASIAPGARRLHVERFARVVVAAAKVAHQISAHLLFRRGLAGVTDAEGGQLLFALSRLEAADSASALRRTRGNDPSNPARPAHDLGVATDWFAELAIWVVDEHPGFRLDLGTHRKRRHDETAAGDSERDCDRDDKEPQLHTGHLTLLSVGWCEPPFLGAYYYSLNLLFCQGCCTDTMYP